MTIEGYREEKARGIWRITVQPSVQIHPGLFVGCNEHYITDEKAGGLSDLLANLEARWDDSLAYSVKIAQDLLQQEQ